MQSLQLNLYAEEEWRNKQKVLMIRKMAVKVQTKIESGTNNNSLSKLQNLSSRLPMSAPRLWSLSSVYMQDPLLASMHVSMFPWLLSF
ncbi:hypothetical protein BELL_0677g00050 [Botrytis elliptica]|uniref:Uncharacterized protein n=1 Tax=Botrytis elliptica TaxID=278938 RepID=A0A4Z1JB02_9HELO|nr:hypothetical protein BELL_0677g00050 [Botrytis elliptica]